MKKYLLLILFALFTLGIQAQSLSIPFTGYTHAFVIGKGYKPYIPLVMDGVGVNNYYSSDSVANDSPYYLTISTKDCYNCKLYLFNDNTTYNRIQIGDSLLIDNEAYVKVYRLIVSEELYSCGFKDVFYKILYDNNVIHYNPNLINVLQLNTKEGTK